MQADSLAAEPSGKPKNTGVGSLSLADLPNPGTDPGSPALQVDSLPAELQGSPRAQDSEFQFPPLENGDNVLHLTGLLKTECFLECRTFSARAWKIPGKPG